MSAGFKHLRVRDNNPRNSKPGIVVCPKCKKDVSNMTAEKEFVKNVGCCSACDHVERDIL